jgi:hypothetical protein
MYNPQGNQQQQDGVNSSISHGAVLRHCSVDVAVLLATLTSGSPTTLSAGCFD